MHLEIGRQRIALDLYELSSVWSQRVIPGIRRVAQIQSTGTPFETVRTARIDSHYTIRGIAAREDFDI